MDFLGSKKKMRSPYQTTDLEKIVKMASPRKDPVSF